MNYNDYYEEVKNDAIEAIDEQFDNGYWDEDTEWDVVYDNLFVDDSVTGNGSGSYTFNAFKARENVSEAIFDDRIIMNYIRENDPESIDVCIRCAMLDEVYDEIERHFSDRKSQLQ